MQGLQRYCNDVVRLDATSPLITDSNNNTTSSSSSSSSLSLSIDATESAETKIQRLISEHPVIIFSRSSCCMCHVMKNLLATIGVHPTIIELDDDEISALPSPPTPVDDHNTAVASSSSGGSGGGGGSYAPAVFIGGTCVGGFESLVALHLSGHLVPKLVEVGALCQ